MYSNQKDQIQLEQIYSNLDNKNLNEGISGVYPKEMNDVGAMVAHILFFIVPPLLYKLKLSLDEGKLKEVKDKIIDAVQRSNSNMSLKDKIVRATNYILQKYSRNPQSVESDLNSLIPSDLENKTEQDISNEMKRKEMGIKNYRGFSGFRG
jgi:hypothetical protein